MENNVYLYTGSPICPKFTLNIGGRELVSGTDYDVEITDNVHVGTAHVIIKGKGKFKGVIERTFEIKPVPARSLSFFADSTEFDYTGEPCVMKLAVRFGDITLTENEDYTVEYVDNIEPGTGSAVLRFSGDYEGMMTVPFAIFRPEPEETNIEEDEEEPEQSEDIPKLVSVSEISADAVRLGESVQVQIRAEGGVAPYTYAVFLTKIKAQNWLTVQDYSEETSVSVTPARATRYLLLVKVKDSRDIIAKQYFKISVSEQ